MALYCYSTRLILITSIAIFCALLTTWGFRRNAPSPFHRTISGHFSLGGDSLDDVFNQTLGFQKIFVMNLASRTDHRDAMSLAAALTGLQIEYVDGVTVVDNRTLPVGGKELKLHAGGLGNWRAHMNVARRIVEQNITSALVLEDDADWDVRIKDQMRNFAKASRLLVQPLSSASDKFLDPSYPKPKSDQSPQNFDIAKDTTSEPSTSPYGDINRWDLFWIGHCGTTFPYARDAKVPIGRALIYDDETVPEPQHVEMQFGNAELVQGYPAHTRVIHRAWKNTCTLAYGISQFGARRLLYELGLNKMTGTTDMMLRSFCTGSENRTVRSCLTVQPQLFQHHRPAGSKASYSDISDHPDEQNEQAFTRNVRWSTRMNFAQLVDGSSEYFDQFMDGEGPNPRLGWK